MIVLDHLTKAGGFESRNVLSSVSAQIPSDRRIALLGPSDQDKRILINLLAGLAMPTSGRVLRRAEVSFPVGQLPGFSKDLSVRVNVAHVARLYGADVRQTLDLVETVFDIGAAFDKAYGDLSQPLRKPLAQILAFGLPFDVYLLMDDKYVPGVSKGQNSKRNSDYSAHCYALFEARLQTSGMIIPTSNEDFALRHCDMAMVLNKGRLEFTDNVRDGFRLERPRRRRA